MAKNTKNLFFKSRPVILGLLGLANLLLLGFFFIQQHKSDFLTSVFLEGDSRDFSEVEELGSWGKTNFADFEDYFQKVAEEKGARYAFDLMKVAPIPANIDMHLLGHAVGDILYKQEGVSGIGACTQDFRNACSHSIVIGLFFDYGDEALPKITEACRQAPGGSGAYTMCFHGLGHGIFAYAGYDIEETVELCKKTAKLDFGPEAVECVGGMTMELVGGGGHDRLIWEKQRAIYLSATNPLYPCSDTSVIPPQASFVCYVYITPYLFEAAGGDLAAPTPKDFEIAFTFCDKIPKAEVSNRNACYGGFGKEFVGLVLGRDIRQGSIDDLSEERMRPVYDWCLLAKEHDGLEACIVHAMNSFYWGGENDRGVAIRFCGTVSDREFQDSCFRNLIISVSVYVRDNEYRKNFCEDLPDDYKNACRSQLAVSG